MSFLCEIQESSYSYMCMSFHVPSMKHRRLMTAACAFLLFFFSSHGYCCAWELEQRLVAVKGTSGALLIPLFFFCLIYPSRLASALSFTLLYPRLYTIVPQQTNSVLGTHTRIHARAWINVKKLLFYLFLLFSWAEAKAYFIFFLLSKKKKKNRSLFFDESCKASQKEAASFVRFILLTCKIEFNDISLLYFVYLSVFFFFLRTSLFVFVWSVTGGKK